jgi:hypothetical protein
MESGPPLAAAAGTDNHTTAVMQDVHRWPPLSDSARDHGRFQVHQMRSAALRGFAVHRKSSVSAFGTTIVLEN